MLIQSAYNLDTLTGLVRLTLRIFKITLILEGIGAVGYFFVFVPRFGIKGIWYGIFHAVSAFCNAGIDLLGGNSFCAYSGNIILNLTTVFLIIVSGLGFPVYWELARSLFPGRFQKEGGYTRKLNLHTRLVIIATSSLIVAGTVLTLLFEFDNPATLGIMSWPEKIMAALFQSVTCHHPAGAFPACLLPCLSGFNVHRRLPCRNRRRRKDSDYCFTVFLHVCQYPRKEGRHHHAKKNSGRDNQAVRGHCHFQPFHPAAAHHGASGSPAEQFSGYAV